MKVSELITELQQVMKEHGDIPAQLQDDGQPIHSHENFFVVAEKYDPPDEWLCNIRWWPY